MKIAFFVNYCHPGGTYFRWHNMALALQDQGHKVDVYAGDQDWKSKDRYEVRDGINYHIVSSLRSVKIFYAPNDFISAIRRLLFLPKLKYDVYHLFQPFLNAYIPWKALQLTNRKSAFIYDWDDLWTGGLFQKPKSVRERYLMKVTSVLEKNIPKHADAVSTCSQFLAERINHTFIQKIYNGFWTKPFADKRDMRVKYQFSEDCFYIGYVGKTADELDWIVEAFEQVNINDKNVKLVIVGPPRSQFDTFSETQKAKITYMGEVSSSQASEIATALDLGLIPLQNSLFNQSRFPIKFFDFLSVGTPVYTSNVGEIAVIGQNIKKAIVGDSNKSNWISGLGNAINHIKQISYNDRDVDLETITDFTWPNILAKQLEFYKQVLVRKNKRINEA